MANRHLHRVLSAFLLVTFFLSNISWAAQTNTYQNNSCLAVPSIFQNNLSSGSDKSAGTILSLVLDVANYAYGDAARGIGRLPIGLLEYGVSGNVSGEVDLAHVGLIGKDGKVVDVASGRSLAEEDDILVIPYTKGGHRYLVQVALRSNPSAANISGREIKGLSDRYVVKVMRDDYKPDIVAPISNGSWIDQNVPVLSGKTVVSLSLEGNIPEFKGYAARDANTKGGLGAYFGDKLEGMASIGINAVGMQPGYSHMMVNGKREKVDYSGLIEKGILVPVLVGKDAIKVKAWSEDAEAAAEDREHGANPEVAVEVYKINRGGATDYILMSRVLDILYTDDRLHRFTQEIVFGKAAYETIKRLNLKPDILHLNEAHTVVAAAQLRADENFDSTGIVYTNHTIVPAGLETYFASSLKTDIPRMMAAIGLTGNRVDQFLKNFLRPDGTVDFCLAACKFADVINGVSKEHALETKRLFKSMYGANFDIQVVGVLNGSGKSWKSDELIAAETSAGGLVSEGDLFKIHQSSKLQALKEVEARTGVRLDPAKPTAWAIRRLVDYKSQYPMLRFLVHIVTADTNVVFTRKSLEEVWLNDIPELRNENNKGIIKATLDKIFKNGTLSEVHGLGMQLVVGGPEYEPYWVHEFKRWSGMEKFIGRFVYVPDSNAELLKMQAIGADICITMPRPLEEACGTSDQRTALNGGVNIAIAGAGPIEWMEEYDEATGNGSGFFMGSYTKQDADGSVIADNPKFYHEGPGDIFLKCAASSDLYHRPGQSKWKGLMYNAYTRSNDTVSSEAMEKRYALDVYGSALRNKSIPNPVSILFEAVNKDANNNRANIANTANILRESLVKANVTGPETVVAVDRTRNIGEVRVRIEEIIRSAESAGNNTVAGDLTQPIETLRKGLVRLEADSIAGSIIKMARQAKLDNQKLIIGIETGWIPGYSDKGGLQHAAMNPLVAEIESLGEIMRSMGIDNVEIVHTEGDALAANVLERADKTSTKMSNIVLLGSESSLRAGAFDRLRSGTPAERAFFGYIDPTELAKDYAENHEKSPELAYNIRLMDMIAIALELATGKELNLAAWKDPNDRLVKDYDLARREIWFLPKAKAINVEELTDIYKAQKAALVAA